MSHALLSLSALVLLSLPAQSLAAQNAESGGATPPSTDAAANPGVPQAAMPGVEAPPAAAPATPSAVPQAAAPLPAQPTVPAPAAAPLTPVPRAAGPALDDAPPSLVSKKISIGGWASLGADYTRMFGRDGAVIGLEGALLFDHRFSLGLGGYAWTNPQEGPADVDGTEQRFQTAYLGGTIRYSFLTGLPVSVTVGALVGGGAITLRPSLQRDEGVRARRDRESDAFMVVQPDVTLHVNVIRWLRLGATCGYRLTAGVGSFDFSESDVNGVIVGGHAQIGRF